MNGPEGYCFSCGHWHPLSTLKMCEACTTMWLSGTPATRRALLRMVKP